MKSLAEDCLKDGHPLCAGALVAEDLTSDGILGTRGGRV